MRRKIRITNTGTEGDVAAEIIRRVKSGKSLKRVPGEREVYLVGTNSAIDFELGEHDQVMVSPAEEVQAVKVAK